MADRHEHRPLSYRPKGTNRVWLLSYAAQTGRAYGAILDEAVTAYRKRVEARQRREGKRDDLRSGPERQHRSVT